MTKALSQAEMEKIPEETLPLTIGVLLTVHEYPASLE